MRRNTLAMAAATLAFSVSNARAQPRRVPRQSCSVTHATLAQFEGDIVDPAVAPAVVFVADGALAVWRERSGALRLGAFDAQWHGVGVVRELARPAGAFSLAATTAGAAVVYVERERDVVLARVNARGEAQNVPRTIAHEESAVDGVAAVRSDAGMLVVWSMSESHALRGVAVDARGVPRERRVEIGAGRAPRLAWQPSLDAATLTVEAVEPGGDAMVLGLSSAAGVNTRLRWPAGTLGPVELTGGLYAAQAHSSGAPVLVRVPPGGVALAMVADAQTRARYTLVDVVADGSTALVLLDDVQGARQLIARASPEGTPAVSTVLRVGPPPPASLSVRADGVAFVAHRETAPHGASRVVVTQVACAR